MPYFRVMGSGAEERELTERELETMRLVVEGFTNQAIADRLGLSRRTVQAHVANAMAKTATSTRTQLAVHALRAGLVPLHPGLLAAEDRD